MKSWGFDLPKTKLVGEDFFNPSKKNKKFLLSLKGKVDLILTDVPYNIADKGKVTKCQGKLYSNAQAWGDEFKDCWTEEEYEEFIEKFLRRSFVLLKEGGSLVTFCDDAYAGVLARIAKKINMKAHLKSVEEKKRPRQPEGFAHKKNIHFLKTNWVPKIRAFNYASAVEVAVWLVKPRLRGSSKAKPEVFNYQKPEKGLRVYRKLKDDKFVDAGVDIDKYNNLGSSNFFCGSIGGGKKMKGDHPCAKYDWMWRPLLEHHSNPGDVVLDPFMGGGSLAPICRELGRNFIGFEQNPKWHKKAVRRMAEVIASEAE